MMGQVFRTAIALDVGRHAPEPRRRAVAQHKALAVRGQPHEPALAGDLLVKIAQVEQGIGAKRVAFGKERPGPRGRRKPLLPDPVSASRWAGTAPVVNTNASSAP